MKVLLTHGYFINEDAKEQQIMRPYVPLGILYISAYLEERDIATQVFDSTFSDKQTLKEYLFKHRPSIVAFYVNLMTKLNVLELMLYTKQQLPNSIVILGGPEVTYNAENFLLHGADYIVIGEGEPTMHELCSKTHDQLKNYEGVDLINGIAYLSSNKTLVKTLEREKLKDLNQLPMPARHKIDLRLYLNAWKKKHGTNAISVSTMRGCPYTCKWCSRAVYGLSYRRRAPKLVVDELVVIKEQYLPDSIWFVDDVFTISHKWLREFNDALKERGVKILYECITRADRMNQEVIRLLKETGCFRVWIGAESGSQRVIDLMDRRVDVHQVRDMIQLTKRYGMEAGTFIMLGYPGETEADIEETIKHLKESDPTHFTITVAYPIKGTELYQEIEPAQTTHLDWDTSTDRQIDFKRTYSRRYYDFAVKRVINEVSYFKHAKGFLNANASKLKIKSIFAKLAMQWYGYKFH